MNPKREKEALDTFIFYNPIMLLHSALPSKVPLSLWSAVWPVARDPGPGGRVWPRAQSDAETSLEQRGPDSTQAVHSSSRGWTGTLTGLLWLNISNDGRYLREPGATRELTTETTSIPVTTWVLSVIWKSLSRVGLTSHEGCTLPYPESQKIIFLNLDFCLQISFPWDLSNKTV